MGCPRPYRVSLCRWAAAPVGPGGEADGGQGDGPGVLVDRHGGGVFGPQCVFLHLKGPFPCTRRHVPLVCSAASSLYPGSPRPTGWGPVFGFGTLRCGAYRLHRFGQTSSSTRTIERNRLPEPSACLRALREPAASIHPINDRTRTPPSAGAKNDPGCGVLSLCRKSRRIVTRARLPPVAAKQAYSCCVSDSPAAQASSTRA